MLLIDTLDEGVHFLASSIGKPDGKNINSNFGSKKIMNRLN
jgi:hypothetical protein